jgi:hypothetical protein
MSENLELGWFGEGGVVRDNLREEDGVRLGVG